MTNQPTADQHKPDARKGGLDAVSLFGAGLRNPSGPAVKTPRLTGRTHDRSGSVRQISKKTLASKGPSTHASEAKQSIFFAPLHVVQLHAPALHRLAMTILRRSAFSRADIIPETRSSNADGPDSKKSFCFFFFRKRSTSLSTLLPISPKKIQLYPLSFSNARIRTTSPSA